MPAGQSGMFDFELRRRCAGGRPEFSAGVGKEQRWSESEHKATDSECVSVCVVVSVSVC